MKRVDLFELHDRAWFPATWRDLLTDFMSHFAIAFRPYHVIVDRLGSAMAAAGTRQVVDLCSGAGGHRWCR